MKEQRKIEVVPYRREWKAQFDEEVTKLKEVMGDLMVNLYHIGSTAIKGIQAKPVIDILIEVEEIGKVDAYNDAMVALDYEAMGENGIRNRRFFKKGGNHRTHHVHIFEKGDSEISRHLNFRDYMNAHPKEARAYSELKAKLAEAYTYDIEGYIQGKNDFIKAIDCKAKQWRNNIDEK